MNPRSILVFVSCVTLGTLSAQLRASNPAEGSAIVPAGEDTAAFEKAIAPAVAEALKTYPQAKQRFIAGLPPRHDFYVTIRLGAPKGQSELVYVLVRTIDKAQDRISGQIASPVAKVTSYKPRQLITFAESEVIDWMILGPHNATEGNFVGKCLDQLSLRHAQRQWSEQGHLVDSFKPRSSD